MPRAAPRDVMDKVALLAALLLFLAMGAYSIQGSKRVGQISGSERPLLPESKVDVEKREARAAEPESVLLDPPRRQSRGENWVFDLFTPPVIYYDPTNLAFAVTPPSIRVEAKEDGQWATFGVELLEVRPRPYRLQLVGYAGEPGNYVAYFEHARTGELLLAREGAELPEAGARVLEIRIRQETTAAGESMPVVENVGVARIEDLATGDEVLLTNRETKMFADLEARVRVAATGAVHVVKEGARIELENSSYVIAGLSESPPEATVTKVSKDGSRSFSRTLVPLALKTRGSGSTESGEAVSPFAIRSRSAAKPPRS